jgi:hypothetical protein
MAKNGCKTARISRYFITRNDVILSLYPAGTESDKSSIPVWGLASLQISTILTRLCIVSR